MTTQPDRDELLYALRVVARSTGLKPELIRAWETRYQAVAPRRTAGGARRYSASDLERLNLLRDVVDAGHRIGTIAHLGRVELRALLPSPIDEDGGAVARALAAAERLDGIDLRRSLSQELSSRGNLAFALDVALPLLFAIGRRWEHGRLSVSAEHLATGIVRSMLIESMSIAPEGGGGARMLFATPSGEPHDIGVLIAALIATAAGAKATFLGADIPTEDLVASAKDSRALALVLGIVTLPQDVALESLRSLRMQLPAELPLWIGGAGIAGLPPIKGVERIDNFAQFEAHLISRAFDDRSVQGATP